MKGCRPLSDIEISGILSTMEKGRFSVRDRALFVVGLRSGFRISELLSLTIGHVFENGNYSDSIAVARKYMKKKREGRTVILHPEAKEALKSLILALQKAGFSGPETYLFRSRQGGNKPLTRQAAWEMIQRVAAQCGITGKIGTHCMRKTFAKRVHEKLGRDLMKTQKALGHAQVTSTVSYLSFNESEIDDAILKS